MAVHAESLLISNLKVGQLLMSLLSVQEENPNGGRGKVSANNRRIESHFELQTFFQIITELHCNCQDLGWEESWVLLINAGLPMQFAAIACTEAIWFSLGL